MSTEPIEKLCEREVVDLHDFLRDWLAGDLPRTADAFRRFDGVIGDEFLIVSPRGTRTERAPLIGEFEGAHGAMGGNGASFEIWVEKYRFHRQVGDHALVTYEEWHRAGDETSARLSTVLFGRREDAPNGVEWLHVHETWLPDQAPAAGERFPVTDA